MARLFLWNFLTEKRVKLSFPSTHLTTGRDRYDTLQNFFIYGLTSVEKKYDTAQPHSPSRIGRLNSLAAQ